jgi:hypothetical protein
VFYQRRFNPDISKTKNKRFDQRLKTIGFGMMIKCSGSYSNGTTLTHAITLMAFVDFALKYLQAKVIYKCG